MTNVLCQFKDHLIDKTMLKWPMFYVALFYYK